MKTTYTKKQFLEDVKKEATLLRDNATDEEKAALDLKTFDGKYYDQCIYGQMTGSCLSLRAARLIFKCCPRYFINNHDNSIKSNVLKHANGATIPKVRSGIALKTLRSKGHRLDHMSAIESYILQNYAKNENLIAYIKGETKNLVL